MRTAGLFVLVLTVATSAMAQVRVDARLEKERYLAGEPVIVRVDVLNVGNEAVAYDAGIGQVRLELPAVARRVLPNIFGCFSGFGGGSGGGAVDHAPLLHPGDTKTYRYLLKDYDLHSGEYQLSVSGRAPVHWTTSARHTPGDPVEGAQFATTLSIGVAPATERELRASFAPLVADADAREWERRYHARAAIVESAPPFFEPLIARFAAEATEYDTLAIEALGRIASPGSRGHLQTLFRDSPQARRRASIMLALARIGHPDDAGFFAGVLQDPAMDVGSRQYAALGLGRIGGDRSVRHLERALVAAAPDLRPRIATALGNTRSASAVPALIGMYGDKSSENEICGGLKTLTHRDWCDGRPGNPVDKRRQWRRAWSANRSKAPIFGPDSCAADRVEPAVVPPSAPAVVRRATTSPRISAVVPAVAAPGSLLTVSGYALGLENRQFVRVLFRQGDRERTGQIRGSARGDDPDNDLQHMDVVVPVDLIHGTWELVIDASGRRSAPGSVTIAAPLAPHLAGISLRTVHPAQFVLLRTATPPQINDKVQMADARGKEWRIDPGVLPLGIGVWLPDDMADGAAHVRLVRMVSGEEKLSAPLDLLVTSAPLPLDASAVAWMTPVPPGQWTELHQGLESGSEFELQRVDRVDVEFVQGRVREVSRGIGPDHARVRVPARLKPGVTSVRTRTWIEKTSSEWSAPASYTVLGPAPRGR